MQFMQEFNLYNEKEGVFIVLTFWQKVWAVKPLFYPPFQIEKLHVWYIYDS